MNSLPRSSISFRRQGSSGRIWQDHMKFMEPNVNSIAHCKEENVTQIEGRRLHHNEAATPSSSSVKIEHKVRKVYKFQEIGGKGNETD
ncbi:hypothetical protein VNO77_35379 [Canavalia gladiata]|uniref:Uncharacterized protein n=1 Tax=Canavalia gladiata TaxID=3824 RepID=A0AAN9KF96_CANGL